MTKEQFLSFKQQNPLDSVKASQLRDQAFEAYLKEGWPTKKEEAWKFTSLSHLKDESFALATLEKGLHHEDLKWVADQLDDKNINLVFINGVFNDTLSDETEGLFSEQEISADDFRITAPTEAKVIHFSQAFYNRKYLLEMDSQYQPDKIIQITFAQTRKETTFINSVLDIVIKENARARIVLNHISQKEASIYLSHHQVKVKIDKAAHLQFLQIQNSGLMNTHLSQLTFDLAEQAQLTTLDLALGGKLARHYVQVNFNHEYAQAGVYGVVNLAQAQHSDHYTFINHLKGHNQSVQKYKSILADQSHSVFRGRVRIEQDAQKASSEQLNNSLMLSREAHVSSIPQLEIYADDVKAGHGATVGQLSQEEMFYLLSRGIDQIQAVKMMSYGFILEMTSVFEAEGLQQKVSSVLSEKLSGMFV